MPGEVDSTDVQLARFFGKPVTVTSSPTMENPSPTTSLASLGPTRTIANTTDMVSDSTRTAQIADEEVANMIKGMLL